MSFSAESSMPMPCSICMQPASTATLTDSVVCACTIVRNPCCSCLAAERLPLFARHRLLDAAPATHRVDDLDDVGAQPFQLANRLAQLGRRSASSA